MATPSILLALVASDSHTILVSYCNPNINQSFLEIAAKVLKNVYEAVASHTGERLTYVFNEHSFNIKSEGKFVFMCLCGQSYGKHMPYVFLNDISSQFFQHFKAELKKDTGPSGSPDAYQSFKSILESKMKTYSGDDGARNDKLIKIQKGLDETKDSILDSIDKVITQTDTIENLLDKTDNLNHSSSNFRKRSKNLHRNLCWAQAKVKIVITFVVLFLLYLLAAGICGLNLQQCSS